MVQNQPARAFKQLGGDPGWWRGAVIYQVYPRSFQDSDGDGVGDLAGLTRRIPHIAALGVDAVWISPFFRSPMKDFGYDVSDYRDVDPMFGSLQDFDTLVAVAHAAGLRVMIDLVISHTSDQHPWFQDSRASHEGDKADWYVWADPKPDGTPPNNWLSVFGGSAWAWDGGRKQYYLHNFLTAQPDLNFHNPAVRTAVLDATRFWLERGVDGFRLDTINFYFHDMGLRDNPAFSREERNNSIAPDVNPYNYQAHVYDRNRPENLDFLRDFRALLDKFPAVASVGEVGDAQRGLEIAAAYTAGDERVHMCYTFDLLAKAAPTPQRIAGIVGGFQDAAPAGWPCWAFSNHDVTRHTTRWGADTADRDAYAAVLMAVLLSLRGSVCLYQGEELGLTEAELAFEDLQDPYGLEFWPEFKGRDGCRTPMPWDGGAPQGGFSTGAPWLPVASAHLARAVAAQEADPTAMLHRYRAMIAFRRSQPVLIHGDLRFLPSNTGLLLFERSDADQTVLCAFNLSDAPVTAMIGPLEPLAGHGFPGTARDDAIELPAYGALFGVRRGEAS